MDEGLLFFMGMGYLWTQIKASVDNQILSMLRDFGGAIFAEIDLIVDAARKVGTPEEKAQLEALQSRLKDTWYEASRRLLSPEWINKLINDRIEDQKKQFSIEDYIEDGNWITE